MILYKKWVRSSNKEGFAIAPIANGNVYFINGTLYSFLAIDKPGNIYLSPNGATIVMYAATKYNPYPTFLTDISGVLQNTLLKDSNNNIIPGAYLTPGNLYYLNIGEKRIAGGGSTAGSVYYPTNNSSASTLKLYGFINSIEFDIFNNIYITDTPAPGYTYKCAVIYMIASGLTTTSPFVTDTLTAGNIYRIAGATNTSTTASNNPVPPAPLSTTPSASSSFKFSANINVIIDVYNNIYVLDKGINKLFLIPSTSANPFPQLFTGNLIAGNVYLLINAGTWTGVWNSNPPPTNTNNGDGGLASSAILYSVGCFTIDSSLNIYIYDSGTIRMICGPNTRSSPFFCSNSQGQTVTTLQPGYIYRIAGVGPINNLPNTGAGSGISALLCAFGGIASMLIDYQGNLHIFDRACGIIRMISATNNQPVSGLDIFPQALGSQPLNIKITQFQAGYIYTTVGGFNQIAANQATSVNSQKINIVSIMPGRGGIDIFGNYYFIQDPSNTPPINQGVFKVIMNTLTCPSPLPTGVASCTSSSSSTPGSLVCTGGYANNSGTSCVTCPAGYYCPQTIDTAGNANGNLKLPCPSGTYNSLTGKSNISACSNCAVNTYSLGGQTNCTNCLAGTYSIPGQPCSNCPVNTYSSDGQPCVNCPTNSTSPAGSSNISNCTCGANYMMSSGQCVCGPNTYGTTICSSCPANATCPGGATFQCLSNYYSDGTRCIACGTGFYSLAGATTCSSCPVANSISCTSPTSFSCQSNYFSNADICQSCPIGSTCAPGGGCNATGLTSIVCATTSGYSFPLDSTTRCEKTKFGCNVPMYTYGTLDQMYNTMPYSNAAGQSNTGGCDTTNPPTCLYNWKTGTTSNIGYSSNNPCPAKNSWYDFSKEKCVDGLGNEVLEMNKCTSNSVYNLTNNACVQVRVPFAQQPPNTIGPPSLTVPGDFSNCKTPDGGDCTPYYKKLDSTGTQAINPCTPGTQYNFTSGSCTVNSNVANSNACCGKPATNLATDLAINATCSNYVQTSITYTKNTTLCPPGATNICCGPSKSNDVNCSKYWTKTPSYSYKASYNTLCGIAGFENYDNSVNTMADKRLQWLQRRQLINA
jgi:hypothetical protein